MEKRYNYLNDQHLDAKHRKRTVRSFLVTCCLVIVFFNTQAQNNRVLTGTILSKDDGLSVIGAAVIEKGTTNGIISDVNGKFTLKLQSDKPVITVSMLGFQSETIIVGAQSIITVNLLPSATNLDEVVVVGYGTQTKGKLTGAVTQVKGVELIANHSVNLTNSIVGKLPGVVAVSGSGTPGSDASTIRIRGVGTMKQSWRDGALRDNNDPLVIVDGVEGSLDRIDPNDIESVSVLKDASAAIYGARAANGVILVTIKKGSAQKTSFQYSYNQGFTQPAVRPLQANAFELGTYYNNFDIESGGIPRYSAEDLEKLKTGADPRHNLGNTNWWDVAVREWAPTSRHNLSAQGGTEKIKYYLSAGYISQEGIFRNNANKYDQLNFRSNIDVQLTKILKLGVNLSSRSENQQLPNTASEKDTWQTIVATDPMFPVDYGNGKYWKGRYTTGWTPALMGTDIGGLSKRETEVLNSIFSYKLDLPFVKGLFLDGFVSINKANWTGRDYQNPYDVYDLDPGTDSVFRVQGGSFSTLNIWESHDQNKSTTLNSKINYLRDFGKHHVNAFVGYEQYYIKQYGINVLRNDYQDPNADINLGDPNTQKNGGYSFEGARQNVISRLAYDFASKYLFEFKFRQGSTNGIFSRICRSMEVVGRTIHKKQYFIH
jgi:TonB-linked SusC/RagA family outer membrane protein